MIQKKYLNRYRLAAEKRPPSPGPDQAVPENKSAGSEKSALRDQPDAEIEQLNSIERDTAGMHGEKSVVDRYKEIAPGIYQFLRPAHGGEECNVQPELTHFCLPQVININSACEPEFQRVDGVPGPYQHYGTPVYQFT